MNEAINNIDNSYVYLNMARSNGSKRAHIIKRDSGWAVKKEGNSKATKVFKTQDAAIKGAQKLRSTGHDVVVHRRDGSIKDWQKKS